METGSILDRKRSGRPSIDKEIVSSPIYYKFGILKINDLYIYKLANLMHKLETKSFPTPILNHFEPLKITIKTNIRSKERGNLKFLYLSWQELKNQ